MSGATARPWGWSRDEDGDIVIHGPPDPETSEIVLVDGVFLSEEDAALIVKDANSHNRLVEALEEIASRTGIDATLPSKPGWKLGEIARAALEEAKP